MSRRQEEQDHEASLGHEGPGSLVFAIEHCPHRIPKMLAGGGNPNPKKGRAPLLVLLSSLCGAEYEEDRCKQGLSLVEAMLMAGARTDVCDERGEDALALSLVHFPPAA